MFSQHSLSLSNVRNALFWDKSVFFMFNAVIQQWFRYIMWLCHRSDLKPTIPGFTSTSSFTAALPTCVWLIPHISQLWQTNDPDLAHCLVSIIIRFIMATQKQYTKTQLVSFIEWMQNSPPPLLCPPHPSPYMTTWHKHVYISSSRRLQRRPPRTLEGWCTCSVSCSYSTRAGTTAALVSYYKWIKLIMAEVTYTIFITKLQTTVVLVSFMSDDQKYACISLRISL